MEETNLRQTHEWYLSQFLSPIVQIHMATYRVWSLRLLRKELWTFYYSVLFFHPERNQNEVTFHSRLSERIPILLFNHETLSFYRKEEAGTSLVIQGLGLHASNAGVMGSIPDVGTKIQHATWCGQKQEQAFILCMFSMEICEIQLSRWIVLNIISENYFKIWEDMGAKWQQLRHLSCGCWEWAHKTHNQRVQGFSVHAEFMDSVWDGRLRETWERLILTKVSSPQRLNIKHLNLEEKYVLCKPLMVEDWLGGS